MLAPDGGSTAASISGYAWTGTAPVNLPATLPAVHKMTDGGLSGMIDSAVEGIIDSTPLKRILAEVTGQTDELTSAAQVWLTQAQAASASVEELKSAARTLESQWTGSASSSFGGFMGNVVGQVESMSEDMAQTAQILVNAAQECQMAQDMVVMIIRELIEWSLMTLATTVAADLLTFGLATVVGGIAEGAEVAAFVERATAVSEKLGKALEDILKMLKEIEEAGKELKSAEGLAKLKKLWSVRKDINKVINEYKLGAAGFRAVSKEKDALEAAQNALKAAKEVGDAEKEAAEAAKVAELTEKLGMQGGRYALGQIYGHISGGVGSLLGASVGTTGPTKGSWGTALGMDLWHGTEGIAKGDAAALGSDLRKPISAPYQLPVAERDVASLGSGQRADQNGTALTYLESLQASHGTAPAVGG